MKPLRILLVVRWPIGGIRTFFRYVYCRFDPAKYRFTVFAPEFAETNLLLQDMKEHQPEYIAAPEHIGEGALVRRVTAVLWRNRFDLIHSHGFTANVSAAFGARVQRIPHIVTLHETLDPSRFAGPMGIVRKSAISLALAAVDRVHCVSNDARSNLLEYLPAVKDLSNKIVVIPNGVSSGQFLNASVRELRAELGLAEDALLIGFFGRYMPEKGFGYLLEALQIVLRSGNAGSRRPILLSFGPEDAYYREERERVRLFGLDQSVHFLPFVPDISSTLKGLDLVVMPSIREAAGLVAMEALVAGIPLIGTDCIGLRETLRGTPARLVSPANSGALAGALIDELQSPTSSEARRFAAEAGRRFDVGEKALQIERLMLSCVKMR